MKHIKVRHHESAQVVGQHRRSAITADSSRLPQLTLAGSRFPLGLGVLRLLLLLLLLLLVDR
jgi:hypothetical protein